MKILQHLTDEEDCLESYTLLGVTIFEKATIQYKRNTVSNKPLKKVYKRFLGRTIYKAKYYNWNGLFKREISIFSLPIVGTLKFNGYKSLFILGIKVNSKPLKFLSDFKKEYLNKINKKHDDVYILLGHLGDAFRMLTLIKNIIKNNQSDHPLIIVFDDSFSDLIEMMNLKIDHIRIDTNKPLKQRMTTQFSSDVFKFDGMRFFLLFNRWSLREKINKHRDEYSHVMCLLAGVYNVKYDKDTMGRVNILPDSESSAIEKSRQAGLNLENFAFICPESFSLKQCPVEFWETIISIFRNAGLDIFMNMAAAKLSNKNAYVDQSRILNFHINTNVHAFYLTISEAYALACRSKWILTMRSGFSEVLVQTQVPILVIYNDDFKSVFKISTHSVLLSPYANKNIVHEIDVAGLSVIDSVARISDMLNMQHSGRLNENHHPGGRQGLKA